MVEPIDQSQFDAVKEAYLANQSGQMKPAASPAPVEPTPAPVPAPKEPIPEPTPIPVSTQTEPAPVPATPDPAPTPKEPVLTFEQELEKRSGGKFKSFEEIEKTVSAPKIIDDEEIQRIYDLKKKGVKIDKEFFELQSLDVTKLDTMGKLIESLKRKPEGRGLSDATLQHKIAKQYSMIDWIDKEPADYTDEDRANYELWNRDATIAGEFLNEYKSERMLPTGPDPEKVKEAADKRLAAKADWVKNVDEIVSKTTQFSIPVEFDKEGKAIKTFDYKISEADGKEIGNTMKLLSENVVDFFNRFALTDEKGIPIKNAEGQTKMDHQRFYNMLVLEKVQKQMAKHIWDDAKALGAKAEVDELKNSGFPQNPGAAPKNEEPKTPQEAILKAAEKKGVKFV